MVSTIDANRSAVREVAEQESSPAPAQTKIGPRGGNSPTESLPIGHFGIEIGANRSIEEALLSSDRQPTALPGSSQVAVAANSSTSGPAERLPSAKVRATRPLQRTQHDGRSLTSPQSDLPLPAAVAQVRSKSPPALSRSPTEPVAVTEAQIAKPAVKATPSSHNAPPSGVRKAFRSPMATQRNKAKPGVKQAMRGRYALGGPKEARRTAAVEQSATVWFFGLPPPSDRPEWARKALEGRK